MFIVVLGPAHRFGPVLFAALLVERFLFEGAVAVAEGLQAAQEFVGAGELAVEAEFVAEELDGIVVVRELAAVDEGFAAAVQDGFVRFAAFGGFEVGLVAEAVERVAQEPFEVGFEGAGFGADDAFVAPEAVGDFVDEVVLQDAVGFEFPDERGEEQPILFGVLGVVGGVDDDAGGVHAVGDGVLGDDCFALIGDGAGGFFGVAAVGFGFFREWHTSLHP